METDFSDGAKIFTPPKILLGVTALSISNHISSQLGHSTLTAVICYNQGCSQLSSHVAREDFSLTGAGPAVFACWAETVK